MRALIVASGPTVSRSMFGRCRRRAEVGQPAGSEHSAVNFAPFRALILLGL
jgi:hypothetical protein